MKHLTDTEHPPKPEIVHLYGCHLCLDTGQQIEIRKTAHDDGIWFSRPCKGCEYGVRWGAMQAKSDVEEVTKGKVPNRKLADWV